MAGGLLQLIAYGAQDIYLTNNPSITFFKTVYRRHTNFSIQQFELTFTDDPGFGRKSSVKLQRLGDLATKMFLRVQIGAIAGTPGINFAWVRKLGHAMLQEIEIVIGGSTIDKHYGIWLDIWYELARQGKHDAGYQKLIGNVDELTAFNDKDKPSYILQIPLQFWFNRHYGLALPLIAIQYHEIYINVQFEPNTRLIVHGDNFTNLAAATILDFGLVTDYIYLDVDERRRFGESHHEYLIEQLQYYGELSLPTTNGIKVLLDFKHPVKELIWCMQNGNYLAGNQFLTYTNNDWPIAIYNFSYNFIFQSLLLLNPNESVPPIGGQWQPFAPQTSGVSTFGNFQVFNNSLSQTLWINNGSLIIGSYNLTSKVNAIITVTSINTILLSNVTTTITARDISIPLNLYTDSRVNVTTNLTVYELNNYGVLIDGSSNPLISAQLDYNGQPRFEERNGLFFGTLQPYQHHSNTPADGINLYSFAIYPELLQPSGTSNMSSIDTVHFNIQFGDTTNLTNVLPGLNMFNLDNRVHVYAVSYNVMRIMSGMVGVSY